MQDMHELDQHSADEVCMKHGQNVSCSSLVPRLPGTRNVHVWRAWYLFSRDRDIIKIGPH